MVDRTESRVGLELRRFHAAFVALLVFSLVISLLSLTPSLFMLQLFERVMVSRSEPTLVSLVVIVGFAALLWAGVESVRTAILQRVAADFVDRLGGQVFATLMEDPASVPANARTMALSDLTSLRDFLSGGLIVSLFDIVWAPVFVVVAFLFHPLLGLAMALSAAVIGVLAILQQVLAAGDLRRANLAAGAAQDFGRVVLSDAETVRVMGMGPTLARNWQQRFDAAQGWQAMAGGRIAVVRFLLRAFRIIQPMAMLAIGVVLYLENQLGAGAIFAVSQIATRAIQPLDSVISQWRGLVSARAAAGRLDQVLAARAERKPRTPLPRPEGALRVSRMSATAPGRESVLLTDISFEVKPGRVLGVVGPSGAGKSTLARLLVGAWRPQRGAIELGAHDLSHWDIEALGAHVGYLPQDVVLLPGTIADTIARFSPRETRDADAVIAAAECAGIADILRALPDGLDTEIAPDRHRLSGGQAQRIALARAVFGDPHLVVLDEPNSNLDAVGEQRLARTLGLLRARGAITVVITHRMAMLTHCDDLLVLNAGVVQAFGPRDLVLSRLGRTLAAETTLPAGSAAA